MRRLLYALAFLIVPFAAVGYGIWKAAVWLFNREDTLTEETMRRIRRDAERAARVKDLTEGKRPKRSAIGKAPSRAHSREWGS
jgi:hypothetical protein